MRIERMRLLGCPRAGPLHLGFSLVARRGEIFDELAVTLDNVEHLAGCPSESEEARDRHQGAEFSPVVWQNHFTIADGGISVDAEIHGVANVSDEASAPERNTPHANLEHVQEKHEENRTGEDVGPQVRMPRRAAQYF